MNTGYIKALLAAIQHLPVWSADQVVRALYEKLYRMPAWIRAALADRLTRADAPPRLEQRVSIPAEMLHDLTEEIVESGVRCADPQRLLVRLHYTKLALRDGLAEISASSGLSRATLCRWKQACEDGGVPLLIPRKSTGRPRKTGHAES